MSDQEFVKISSFNNFLYVESSSLPKKSFSSKKVSWFLESIFLTFFSEVETMPEGLQSTGVRKVASKTIGTSDSAVLGMDEMSTCFRSLKTISPKDHNLSLLNVKNQCFLFFFTRNAFMGLNFFMVVVMEL